MDTHALLWHLTEDDKLGRKAKEVLDGGDRGEKTIIIPTMVSTEALFILEKKRVDLKFREILNMDFLENCYLYAFFLGKIA